MRQLAGSIVPACHPAGSELYLEGGGPRHPPSPPVIVPGAPGGGGGREEQPGGCGVLPGGGSSAQTLGGWGCGGCVPMGEGWGFAAWCFDGRIITIVITLLIPVPALCRSICFCQAPARPFLSVKWTECVTSLGSHRSWQTCLTEEDTEAQGDREAGPRAHNRGGEVLGPDRRPGPLAP